MGLNVYILFTEFRTVENVSPIGGLLPFFHLSLISEICLLFYQTSRAFLVLKKLTKT